MQEFHGVPVWHASVAFQPHPPPVAQWTRQMRRQAERTLRELVAGIGRPGSEFLDDHQDGTALHLRKPATLAEEHAVGGARDDRCEHRKGLIVP